MGLPPPEPTSYEAVYHARKQEEWQTKMEEHSNWRESIGLKPFHPLVEGKICLSLCSE